MRLGIGISPAIKQTPIVAAAAFTMTFQNNANGTGTLSWNAQTGATRYDVYQGGALSGTPAETNLSSGTLTKTVTRSAGIYLFKIKVTTAGGSSFSNELSCQITGGGAPE